MYILGIDIGTTKIAGVLLEVPESRIVKVISMNTDANLSSQFEWEKTQDPSLIIKHAHSIISELKESVNEKVACIGISSQMHGFLYVSNEGGSLSPLYTWQDNRAAIPTGDSGESVQRIIKSKTGKEIYSGYALATHYYNTINGKDPDQPYQIVSIGGFLGMQLCGLKTAFIDPSEAASFGLYDLEKKDFFLDDLKALWGNVDFLPQRVPFFARIGFDGDGIPVFQSMGDNQASFYGAMQGRDEKLLLNLGTGGQVSLLSDQIPSSLKGLEVRPYPEKNLIVGSTLAGGKSFDLLVDFFSEVLSFFGKPMAKSDMFRIIDSLESTDPVNPLIVNPYFNGTRLDPAIRGSITNIDLDNLTTSNLLSGFAVAMVKELKDLLHVNNLDQAATISRIVGSGNGIRRNPLVCRTIEDFFQCELYKSDLKEEAACGAAFYAFYSLEKL